MPWQVSQVVDTTAWVAWVMFMGPKVPTAYVVDLWHDAAVGAGEVRNVRGRKHIVLDHHVIVVERQLGAGAVALRAAAADAGVQYRIRREYLVIRRCGRVANVAGLVGRVRHVSRGQRRGNPVGRGVAQAAIIRSDLLTGGVIGRAALQSRACRAHVETQTRLMAGLAGHGRHIRVRGLRSCSSARSRPRRSSPCGRHCSRCW